MLEEFRRRLATVANSAPVIVTTFPLDAEYEALLRDVCPDLEAVEHVSAFHHRVLTYQASDRLLIAHPGCFPIEAADGCLARFGRPRESATVRHLIAVQRGDEGTVEYVDTDSNGGIRGIQRYYDSVTWPFGAGVVASLVPVATFRVMRDFPLGDLARLRHMMSSEGVPTQDFPLKGGAVNLSSPLGYLTMNQAIAMDAHGVSRFTRAKDVVHGSRNVRVDPSAAIVGPVVLQDGVHIGEGAKIIGPSVLGRGATVQAGAIVAQSVIGAKCVVPAHATLRHRVLLGAEQDREASEDGFSSDEPDEEEFDWDLGPLAISVQGQRHSVYPVIKRTIDFLASSVGLLLLSPLWLLVAILIKLESRGPVHFGHLREGKGGRTFRCWKFRTMVQNADQQQRTLSSLNQMDGPQFKVKRDPRRTRIGSFLSATNLDEIPQLWNVLVGDMSLVGPRPSPFRENQLCVPWREGRLSVRPGMTGLWQICRHDRDRGDFHQWIYYDLLYVRNLSFWLDFKILVLTPLSFERSGYIPLKWLLPPKQYGERRALAREPQSFPLSMEATEVERRASPSRAT